MTPTVTQPAPPTAVLWDMDGTLVDTEPYWIDTEFALAEKYGGTWSQEHAMNLVGNALLDSGEYIREHMGIDRTPQQIVDELLDGVVARVEAEVPWRPGARELLADLREHAVPCALVTMSWQRFVDPILAQLPDDTFASVVTGDRVELGKPHPEPYLKAAAELGVDPVDCVAIEDSNTGARSAVAAGCTVVCVPNHVPILEGERRVFAPSLEGLGVPGLTALLDEHAARERRPHVI
ncbi:haloacid dehalogenase [Nocardioides flavus (ex Wang et al. 2016)]|uniref:Haloacid dehalogenase n=1 Tax=Nocardioides flavus (ex Wang et al. 2016) TaxID=2058780 RepID=A0ABQ3HPK2_9ACTN|nr:HAD family phosphatase [Nocardioides flavus (ex Wang et al. 2016)]GHE18661.1 haloacid dehalogenase [Nocardioides flavus (ex Wang et al. 2016)]